MNTHNLPTWILRRLRASATTDTHDRSLASRPASAQEAGGGVANARAGGIGVGSTTQN